MIVKVGKHLPTNVPFTNHINVDINKNHIICYFVVGIGNVFNLENVSMSVLQNDSKGIYNILHLMIKIIFSA